MSLYEIIKVYFVIPPFFLDTRHSFPYVYSTKITEEEIDNEIQV